MSVQSACEHDFGFYRPVAGSGQDITHECELCGARVVQEGNKTRFYRQIKEEEKERKKTEHKKRVAKAKRKAKEKEDSLFDKSEEAWEYTKDKVKDIFD